MPTATVDAALTVSRALVAISVASVSELDGVTLQQFRVLTVLRTRTKLNVNAVAAATGIHSSNVSRTCERLVSDGLLIRRDDPGDRRNVQLELTEAGRAVVDGVMRRRRRLLTGLLGQLTEEELDELAGPLTALAAVATEIDQVDEWSGGWDPGEPRR